MDTYEFTFPGGSAIITTTTGGTKLAPDFVVYGPNEEAFEGDARSVFAAECLRLAEENLRLSIELDNWRSIAEGRK